MLVVSPAQIPPSLDQPSQNPLDTLDTFDTFDTLGTLDTLDTPHRIATMLLLASFTKPPRSEPTFKVLRASWRGAHLGLRRS